VALEAPRDDGAEDEGGCGEGVEGGRGGGEVGWALEGDGEVLEEVDYWDGLGEAGGAREVVRRGGLVVGEMGEDGDAGDGVGERVQVLVDGEVDVLFFFWHGGDGLRRLFTRCRWIELDEFEEC
jgi:hypothetical protein